MLLVLLKQWYSTEQSLYYTIKRMEASQGKNHWREIEKWSTKRGPVCPEKLGTQSRISHCHRELIRVLMCLCLYLCCDDDNHCINIICQVESHLIINVVHQRQGSTLILLSNYLISSPSQWDANTTSALSEPIHQLTRTFRWSSKSDYTLF